MEFLSAFPNIIKTADFCSKKTDEFKEYVT